MAVPLRLAVNVDFNPLFSGDDCAHSLWRTTVQSSEDWEEGGSVSFTDWYWEWEAKNQKNKQTCIPGARGDS